MQGLNTVLLIKLQSVTQLRVDGSSLYWVDDDGRTVKRLQLAGGTPTLIATAPDWIGTIAFDATCIYYSTGTAIFKVAK